MHFPTPYTSRKVHNFAFGRRDLLLSSFCFVEITCRGNSTAHAIWSSKNTTTCTKQLKGSTDLFDLEHWTFAFLGLRCFLWFLCNLCISMPSEKLLVFFSECLVHYSIYDWINHSAQLPQKRVHHINLTRKVPTSLSESDEIHDRNRRPANRESAHGQKQRFRNVYVLHCDFRGRGLVKPAPS